VKPAPFDYYRASSLGDAVSLLDELGEDAKVLAGGQSLVPMMAFRLARPAQLVDITGLQELRYIRGGGDGLHIGGLTTHHEVETSGEPALTAEWDVLRRTMRWIGHLPIRTMGTVGGSLAHGDALAEWCLLSVLLDAIVVVVGTGGRRLVPAADFLLGYYTTALKPGELVVEVHFPVPAPHASVTEYAERQGDFAIVAAAVSLDVWDGEVRAGRVAISGVADVPVRVPAAEAVLGLATGRTIDECFAAAARAAASAVDPTGDHNGSAGYRRALTETLVLRACQEAMSR
jgi:aerobic carbon-monoxide dehydrogenase medium subunit